MRSIDPVHSLAFSIQANPGVYAVLVGSGVSRAAKIPTGWEITLDLIRKLAAVHKEECEPDPERWYLEKFGKEPTYSDILSELGTTQAERQQLLRPYFEPTDEEREEGVKAPTAAHRAIAALAARGFIKVIITTNFDRLVEAALTDEGVVPTILSSVDQVKGALPLIHTQCCVFKVNGDYLDTRIRNTPAELDEYPREFDELLDRIFDDFGLIVCGWSAEWDGALCKAMFRASSHRFTTYWAARGEPGDQARRLIEHRRAELIPVKDADTFFSEVQQNVESIEEFSKPHPLSTEAAVASLERYLPDPRYRIQLSNLIQETAERVVEVTSGKRFTRFELVNSTSESTTGLVRRYGTVCSTLLAMATVGGLWAEEEHCNIWQRALQRLGSTSLVGHDLFWIALRKFPGTLFLYALGLGALEAERLWFLRRLFETTIPKNSFGKHENYRATQQLLPDCLFSDLSVSRGDPIEVLERMHSRRFILNHWIHDALRPHAKRIITDDDRYTLMFDKLEILMALSYAHGGRRDGYWAPPAASGCRHSNWEFIIQEMEESFSEMEDESPYVRSEIFGQTATECRKRLADLRNIPPIMGLRR